MAATALMVGSSTDGGCQQCSTLPRMAEWRGLQRGRTRVAGAPARTCGSGGDGSSR